MDGRFNRQPLLDTQQNQLGVLLDDSASIDAKALGIFAANVAILIFIAQYGFVIRWYIWVLLLFPFMVSIIYNAVSLYPRRYDAATIDIDAHPEYLAMDEETLTLQLISDTKQAIDTNSALNKKRWLWTATSFGMTVIGSLVLFMVLTVK